MTKDALPEQGVFRVNAWDQCFLVVVFVFDVVVMLPMVLVPVVPDVVVAVVPVVLVALVWVTIVPDVSVVVPAGIAEVSVEPVVLVIAVPDVSLDTAAVSVTFVFSSFLQAKANSATATTIKIASDLFK